MDIDQPLVCPKCNGIYFEIKREATYLYTYKLDTPLTGEWSKEKEVLPFLFDDRELTNTKDYLECRKCSAKYPYDLESGNSKIHLTILQKAIRSDFQESPEFWG